MEKSNYCCNCGNWVSPAKVSASKIYANSDHLSYAVRLQCPICKAHTALNKDYLNAVIPTPKLTLKRKEFFKYLLKKSNEYTIPVDALLEELQENLGYNFTIVSTSTIKELKIAKKAVKELLKKHSYRYWIY